MLTQMSGRRYRVREAHGEIKRNRWERQSSRRRRSSLSDFQRDGEVRDGACGGYDARARTVAPFLEVGGVGRQGMARLRATKLAEATWPGGGCSEGEPVDGRHGIVGRSGSTGALLKDSACKSCDARAGATNAV